MKELRMDTILHPPIEGGVGSDIGEKFLGDAEWDTSPEYEAEVRKANDATQRPDVEEGRDYQKVFRKRLLCRGIYGPFN